MEEGFSCVPQLLLYQDHLQPCRCFKHPLAAGSKNQSGINPTIHTLSWDWPKEFTEFSASTLYFQGKLLQHVLED